jgi:hypothetical protein
MRTFGLILVLLSLGACSDGFVVPAAQDAGTDAICAVWGLDGTGMRYCVSTEPDPCSGPWGCAGK